MRKKSKKLKQMTDAELNSLHKTVAEGLVTLSQQSEANGDSSRARILIYALGGFLWENGILGELVGYGSWMAEQEMFMTHDDGGAVEILRVRNSKKKAA